MQVLDWLIIVTVGAIVLVLLDGFRRKWSERRNRVVMKLERNIPQEDTNPDEIPNSELPNGGARTLPRSGDEPVLPRKRYFGLRDGRERRQQQTAVANPAVAQAQAVPVLMDPVEVDEAAIEHANVYVTAESILSTHAAEFASEGLPPEVVAGLDGDFADDEEPASAETESSSSLDANELMEELADQFVAANPDPLLAGYGDDDAVFDAPTDTHNRPNDAADDLSASHQMHPGDESAEDPSDSVHDELLDALPDPDEFANDDDTDDGEAEFDDEDVYTGEADYESEPALLENAYRLAASHFQRPPPPSEPRIEPGFGGESTEGQAAEQDIDSKGSFTVSLDEGGMEEFLDSEQEEIRAWRSQSVSQQTDLKPAPALAPTVVADAPAGFPKPPVHKEHGSTAVEDAAAPTYTVDYVNEPPTAVAVLQASEPVAARAAKEPVPAKPGRPGFWESMANKATGNVGKVAAKVATARANQGELFQENVASSTTNTEHDSNTAPQEVIIINVMARTGLYFYGDELLPVLQHYGLRLGSMNIFHRHGDADGGGPVMFSMANMVKPGTFALASMQELVTPGVSFFVQLPNRHGNMKAFELMLATANGVKQALLGDLKDERRSVLTRQTVEHLRQRIRDFELSQLAKK